MFGEKEQTLGYLCKCTKKDPTGSGMYKQL